MINEEFIYAVYQSNLDIENVAIFSSNSHRTRIEYFFDLNKVIELLRRNADIHCYNDRALQLSINRRYFEITTVLLENGANVYRDSKRILKDLKINFDKSKE